MNSAVQVYEQFLTQEERQAIATCPAYLRAVPNWLGTFQFRPYYKSTYLKHPVLGGVATRLAALVPDQTFNTAFLQRYETGSCVRPHRDPRNNVGFTVIAVAGEFTGAETKVSCPPGRLHLRSGDVLVMPCTIDGVQGPWHEVSEVTSGTRHALILNTISDSRR